MQQTTNSSSRKKFLWWGAAIVASITGIRFFTNHKQKSKDSGETIKMLTQDGRLVEVDKKLLAPGSKKISTEELKQWVNKNSAQ